MDCYLYYCLMRPVGPGAVPHGFVEWGSLDGHTVIPSIGHHAWSWVAYPHPLTAKEIRSYELAPVPAGDSLAIFDAIEARKNVNL